MSETVKAYEKWDRTLLMPWGKTITFAAEMDEETIRALCKPDWDKAKEEYLIRGRGKQRWL